MAAIATQAGLSPPSLYRYFPDAAAVIHAVAERSLDELHTMLEISLDNIDSDASARAALQRTMKHYHQAFVDDRALREIWTGTFANRELVSLNIADSRRNGALIAARIGPWSDLDRATLRTRAFLLAHLTGAGITLVLDTPPAESRRLRHEMGQLIDMLFTPR